MDTETLSRTASLDAHSGQDTAVPGTARVLRRFRVVFNAVRRHFQQIERQVGLGGAQVWALSLVNGRPGLGIGEMAQLMDIHPSTASNLVKALLQRGLIRMERLPQDRRSAQLFILPAGQDMLARVPGPFEGVLPMALGRLPVDTLARLDADLAELIVLLQADEAAGAIPLAEL